MKVFAKGKRSLRNFYLSSTTERVGDESNNIKIDEGLILKLASKKRFDKLASLLLSEYYESAWHSSIPNDTTANIQEKHSADTSRVSDSSVEETGSTIVTPASAPILHQVLQHRPPLVVVDLMCAVMQFQRQNNIKKSRNTCFPEDMVDLNEQNPLHIAVIQGCELHVIQRLLEGSDHSSRVIVNLGPPRPACCRDYLGRTPLHWACANPHGHFGKKKKKIFFDFFKDGKKELKACIQRQCKVVEMLLQDSPKVVDINDNNGQSPLDLAYQNDADPEIFRLLILAARTFSSRIRSHQHQNKSIRQKERQQGQAFSRFLASRPSPPLLPKYKSTHQLNSGFHERRKKMVNKSNEIVDPSDWSLSFYSLDNKKLKPNLLQTNHYDINNKKHTVGLNANKKRSKLLQLKKAEAEEADNKERSKFGQYKEEAEEDEEAVSDASSDFAATPSKVKRSWNPLDLIVDCGNDCKKQQQPKPEDDISSIGSDGASVYHAVSREVEDRIFLQF